MSDPSSVGSSAGSSASGEKQDLERQIVYRKASLRVIFVLLPIWFFVSYGCGILFRDWLDANAPRVGNAPFGFWMAQQGAVICFVIVLVVYAAWMNRLDRKLNQGEGN
ncbi:DUF4212 domain-containing protein [Pelagicoccus sp. SDUM812005]|uniref:DUF4212 domain-containing protein n=1 Tax=Pelagicoccus sp. SDUM812005 TaxID=3041257 RepID=UPI00280D5EFA|nr:DUF4212 domain-containing protein [Pelagicoccus sp. SDUM812005]MDQ8182445.1 DUF4212 domain-containing protein [Pelagicoccus sp. SDUM812005]